MNALELKDAYGHPYKEAVVPPRDIAQWLILIVVLLVSICALALSIGTFVFAKPGNESEEASIQSLVQAELNKYVAKSGNESEEASIQSLIQEFNKSVSQLKAALELSSAIHEQHYQQLNATIFTAVESMRSVSAANELDLTTGCGAPITATCIINHNDVSTPPASATCETPEEPLDVPGFRNVNIYCSIDNGAGETNPVTSTLNIFNGEVSCLCSLVAFTAPIASPGCTLTIQRCPDTIRLNLTSMQ